MLMWCLSLWVNAEKDDLSSSSIDSLLCHFLLISCENLWALWICFPLQYARADVLADVGTSRLDSIAVEDSSMFEGVRVNVEGRSSLSVVSLGALCYLWFLFCSVWIFLLPCNMALLPFVNMCWILSMQDKNKMRKTEAQIASMPHHVMVRPSSICYTISLRFTRAWTGAQVFVVYNYLQKSFLWVYCSFHAEAVT